MIAAFLRISGRAVLGLACLTTALRAEVLDFRYARGSTVPATTAGAARILAVEALPEAGPNAPARAFAGGFFSGAFEIPPLAPIFSQSGEDGVLTALTKDPATGNWRHDWLLQAESTGNARINDVALAAKGPIYVTGTFTGEVIFRRPGDPPVTFSAPPGATEGFVAWADPAGNWIDAFPAREMEPRSLALGDEGDIFLTGPPELARQYDPDGGPVWSEPAPPETIALRHIALGPTPEGPRLYVTGSFKAGSTPGGLVDEDVFLARLTPLNAGPDWTRVVASPGIEHPGGLGVGPLGEVRLSFSSDDPTVTYDGNPIPTPPLLPARHAYVLDLTPDGDPLWATLLGEALEADGEMESADLAIDPAGNVHVAATYRGSYAFEGVTFAGQDNAAVVSVDAAGEQFNFSPSAGTASQLGLAVAAPDRRLQILAGEYLGPGITRFGPFLLPAADDARAYLAIVEPAAGQEAYIVSSPADEPPQIVREELNRAGAQVYRLVDAPAQGVRFVSAFITEEQLNGLEGRFILEPDRPMRGDGVIDPSGWALAHLNDATGASTTYTYPETCRDTVLYLIDTAVDNTSGYFDGNPKLTLGATILVRGTGDPLVSSSFDHGTKMLSMIAGPTQGVAQGTPVTVINYDIYATPGDLSTRLSALVEALTLANLHKLTNHPFDPAVVCIASSASSPSATSPALGPAVAYTTGAAVRSCVVVSAGNTSGLAKDYIPSSLGGTVPGVICAGAIDAANTQLPSTRGGSGVDLWAPGAAVPAVGPSGSATTVTGTSASAALTAGAALVYLGGNPFAGATKRETALVTTFSQSDTVGPIPGIPTDGVPWFTSFADWASWYLLADTTTSGNDDGDRWRNEEEFIWGFDPTGSDHGPLLGVSYDGGSGTLTVEFPLACYLYDQDVPATRTLRDSSSLRILRSPDLSAWTDITSSLTIKEVETNDGQITLSFDYAASSSPCFFRVQVAP